MKRIRLLFDSVNENTGDRAIGEVMAKFVADRGADPVIIDPLDLEEPEPPVVIGGGELIHAPGDLFYASFRLEGEHILNAAGITSPLSLEYLKNYTYVAVRSSLDKKLIEGVRPDAAVVPCVATVLEPEDPPEEIDPERTILIHLHHNALHHCRGIPDLLATLKKYEIYWLSLTPYAGDGATMARLGATMNREINLSGAATPQEKVGAISRCRLLICASLHGAIFAHANNIPFLVFSRPPKIKAFLEDRGLDHHGFSSTVELRERLNSIISRTHDFSGTIEKDLARLNDHFAHLADLLELPRNPIRNTELATPNIKPEAQRTLEVLHGLAYRQALVELSHLSHQTRGLRQVNESLQAELAEQRRNRGALSERAQDAENEAKALRGEITSMAAQLNEERIKLAEARVAQGALADLLRHHAATSDLQAEFLSNISHQLVRLNEELHHATETRVSRQILKVAKRIAKKFWHGLPDDRREQIRPQIERILGRQIPVEVSQHETAEISVDHDKSGFSARRRRATSAIKQVTPVHPDNGAFPDVSILIPTWNAGDEFKRTLDALASQSDLGELELVVVDSGSGDQTIDLARDFGARIEHIAQTEFNHGATRNLLAEMASNDNLIFMTQDAVPANRHTIAQLVSLLSTDERIAACSARQIPRVDCGLHAAYNAFHHYRALDLNATLIFPPPEMEFTAASYVHKRRWAAGLDNVCSAIRRQAWEQIRFRPTKFAEDLDFAIRAFEAGWKIAFCNDAAVIHSHDRPALYHLRRHIADRLYAAKILRDPALVRNAPGSLEEVLTSSVQLVSTADRTIWAAQQQGLAATLHALRNAISQHATEEISIFNENEWLRFDDFREVVEFLDTVGRQDVAPAEVVRSLAADISTHLANPHLDEFVAINRHCDFADGARFLTQLFGGYLGVAIGHAASCIDDESELIEDLVRGI